MLVRLGYIETEIYCTSLSFSVTGSMCEGEMVKKRGSLLKAGIWVLCA